LSLPGHNPDERRRKTRHRIPFIVRVRGVDVQGCAFEAHTVIENISAIGLFLQLPRPVAAGSRLLLIVTLSTRPAGGNAAARIAVRGVVLRAEARRDGLWGLALRFTGHRFLGHADRGGSGDGAGNDLAL
jgi:PilZ domain